MSDRLCLPWGHVGPSVPTLAVAKAVTEETEGVSHELDSQGSLARRNQGDMRMCGKQISHNWISGSCFLIRINRCYFQSTVVFLIAASMRVAS
jgi:hypothetical protein